MAFLALGIEIESRLPRFCRGKGQFPSKNVGAFDAKNLPCPASVDVHEPAPAGTELCVMSAVLDAKPELLRRVHAGLLRQRKADARLGREGMTAEQVVRAALVKQMFGCSYHELAFRLGDSLVLRGFCRLWPSSPKRSALQTNIASIRPETWEAMNKALVLHAR